MPACVGSQIKGPNSRIDLLKKHAGIDIVAMYPVGGPPKAEAWTLDAMLKAAEACHKGGNPFGIGLGTTEDNVDTAGAIFQSFGAELVDAKGDYHRQVGQGSPGARILQEAGAVAAPRCSGLGQRRQQQVSDLRQGLADHEPAERLGGRQTRRAASCGAVWTHGMPSGPVGRYAPFLPYFWAIWSFGKNKTAAKDLILFLSQRLRGREDGERQRRLRPACLREAHRFQDLGRDRAAPGTLYHYPNPYNHQILSVAAQPAPPKIAHQIYTQAIHTKMIVRFVKGEAMEKTLAWAEGELEGFMRDVTILPSPHAAHGARAVGRKRAFGAIAGPYPHRRSQPARTSDPRQAGR